MEINGNELIAVFLLLSRNEDLLDDCQLAVKAKAEKEIFSRLSIEEIESLEVLYEKKVDVMGKKR